MPGRSLFFVAKQKYRDRAIQTVNRTVNPVISFLPRAGISVAVKKER